MALNTHTRITSGRHEARIANAFQVMPDLSVEDYEALKADIAERGVLIPVEYDEDGNVLDGHHRLRACAELGIKKWPKIIRKNMSEEGKRLHARQLNLARRHLDSAQKRELIAAQIKDTPAVSNRQIAASLGVSHPTVAAVREGLEERGDVEKFTTSTDTLGRQQKAKKPRESRSLTRSFVPDADMQAEAEAAARDLEIERDERIALSGTDHLVEENERLTKQVATLSRRVATLASEKSALEYREKMWRERAIAAGWKARADA